MWCCTNKAWIVDEQKTALQKVIELPSTTCTCPVSDKRHDEQTVWTVLTVGCLNWRDIEREKSVRRWSKVGRRRKKNTTSKWEKVAIRWNVIFIAGALILFLWGYEASRAEVSYSMRLFIYMFFFYSLYELSPLCQNAEFAIWGALRVWFFSFSLSVFCACAIHIKKIVMSVAMRYIPSIQCSLLHALRLNVGKTNK